MNTTGDSESPLVTVLMPVHNGEAFVAEAIRSILGQTFTDFEFLIIDDESTDRSVEIIEQFADRRIRLVRNERRLALIRTLNRGLELARGRYVARMDADDISLPERLEKQVAMLESNPDVGACGTWVETMGEEAGAVWRYPRSSDDIRCRLLFDSALAHPAVCIRRESFARHHLRFNEAYPHAEDFDYWSRASDVLPLVNLGEILLRYRIHDESVSQRYRDVQESSVRKIHRERLARMGLTPTEEELSVHRGIASGVADGKTLPLASIGNWLEKLLRANQASGFHPRRAFEKLLGRFWLAAAHRTLDTGLPALKTFADSPLARCVDFDERIRLLVHAAKHTLRVHSEENSSRA